MKNDKQYTSGGIGFTGALTILFIALKLCGVIEWSWLWVLSPIWIIFIIIGVVLIVFFLVEFIKALRS